MRADAHYVEELDSALFTAPVRHLDVRTIDPIQREGAELPLFWRPILAEEDAREGSVPGGSATTSALTLLRAARQVAELHGGRMSVDCRDGMTSLSIAIPASR